jgi:hypothetical protein
MKHSEVFNAMPALQSLINALLAQDASIAFFNLHFRSSRHHYLVATAIWQQEIIYRTTALPCEYISISIWREGITILYGRGAYQATYLFGDKESLENWIDNVSRKIANKIASEREEDKKRGIAI